MEKLLAAYKNAIALNDAEATFNAQLKLIEALGAGANIGKTRDDLMQVVMERIAAEAPPITDIDEGTPMPLSATTGAVIIAAFVTFWSLAIYGAYKLFLEWIL